MMIRIMIVIVVMTMIVFGDSSLFVASLRAVIMFVRGLRGVIVV